MLLFKTLLVTLILCTASAAHAACTSSCTPGGYVWDTNDPHVYRVFTHDCDNYEKDDWARLFFHAGTHSRSVYVKSDRNIELPEGTISIYAVNITNCGNFVGSATDTWLRTVVVPK